MTSPVRFPVLNPDTLKDVCAFLPASDVLSVELTCRIWNKVAKKVLDQRKENLKAFVFGANKWEQYYGKVERIPLPFELVDLLDRPCPFWADKRIKDTHMIFLLPKTVDESPTTLNSIGLLVQKPKEGSGGHATKYAYVTNRITPADRDAEIPHSLWILMTKKAIGIRKLYAEQKQYLQGVGYVPPKILNAVTGIFTHYVETQEKLYAHLHWTSKPWASTNCQEEVRISGSYSTVCVGEFQDGGLQVFLDLAGEHHWQNKRNPFFKDIGGMREFHGPPPPPSDDLQPE